MQKSRMPQNLGVEGEAVVLYRESSTTQEMRYPRLSRRVNKMAVVPVFRMPPVEVLIFSVIYLKNPTIFYLFETMNQILTSKKPFSF